MPNHEPSGSLKLRGLLSQSCGLLRQGLLDKAATNAQIVREFAARSGEAPEVVYGAQLLVARIHAQRARFRFDDGELELARRIVDGLAAEGAPYGHEGLAHELALTRAAITLRGGEAASAKTLFDALAADPEVALVTRLDARVGIARSLAALAQAPLTVTARAEAAALIAAERAAIIAEGAGLSRAARPERPPHARQLAGAFLAEARVLGGGGDHVAAGIDLAQRAKHYARVAEDAVAAAEAEVVIGSLSRRRGNYAIGMRLLYGALEAAERMGHARLALEAHEQIARVYRAIRHEREAEKHLRYVAEAAERHGRDDALYFATLALGRSALRARDLAAGMAWLTAALNAALRTGVGPDQGGALAEIGDLHFVTDNFELARHYRDAAAKRFADAGTPPAEKVLLVSAKLALRAGRHEAALGHAGLAAARARDVERYEVVAEALRIQSAAHEGLGDYGEALAAEREASAYLGRLIDEDAKRQLGELDMRAALREREREIEKLTRENDLKGALIAKNEEIERANADLLQANEELRQFAFVASHDLKEPLRQVGSYVSLLKRKFAGTLDEDGETYFAFVTEGVARLNRLFDSLMHYTAVARMDRDVHEVDLGRIVAAVRHELAASIRAAGAELRHGDLPTIQTAPQLLRHVMAALIDNAVRFRRPGVAPVIDLSVGELDGMLAVSVRDNGIGIDRGYQDKVFQLFQMLEAKSGNPGVGVGLAIAQKTVQRLGGRIWYEDNPDGSPGVTFRFTLPMGVERALPTGANAAAALAQEAA